MKMIMSKRSCWFPSVIAHELGHVLGLNHEQQRTDRARYIYTSRVKQAIFSSPNIDPSRPYCFFSTMHYGHIKIKDCDDSYEDKNHIPCEDDTMIPDLTARSRRNKGLVSCDVKAFKDLYKKLEQ